MTSLYDVLRRPIITEKSNSQNSELHQYTFEVTRTATKTMIKEAVETIFNVTVEKVNVLNVPFKQTRRARNRRVLPRKDAYKKAVVTLAADDTIDMFEGVK